MGQVLGVNGANSLERTPTGTSPAEQLYISLARLGDDETGSGIRINLPNGDSLQDSADSEENRFTNNNNAEAVETTEAAASRVRDNRHESEALPAYMGRLATTADRLDSALSSRGSRYNLDIVRELIATHGGIDLNDIAALSKTTANGAELIRLLLVQLGLTTQYEQRERAANPTTTNPPAAPVAGAGPQTGPVRDINEFLASRGIQFTIADANSNGQIDWSEVLAVIDTNSDGELSLTEFNAFLRAHNAPNSALLSRALFNLIDNGMVAGTTGGNRTLSQTELMHAIEVMQEYAEIIGAEFNDVVEAYNGEDTFTNEDFAMLRGIRENVNRRLIAYCQEHYIVLDASITTAQAREILVGVGLGEGQIEAVMEFIENQASLTAEFLESCVMRLVEAARRDQASYGLSVRDLPFFPGELESTGVQRSTSGTNALIEAALSWLAGEEMDLSQFDAAIEADREFVHIFDWDVFRGGPSQQRQLLGAYIHRLLSEGNYAMAERVMQLVAEPNGEYYIIGGATDGQIHRDFAATYAGAGRLTSAARHANLLPPGEDRTRAFVGIVDRAIHDGDLRLAYQYIEEVRSAQEGERLLRSLVTACIRGNNHNMSRVDRLDLAWTILRSPAYAFNDREELLLNLIRIYSSNNSGGRQEDGNRTREVRTTAVDIVQWMISDEGDGLGYGADYQVQVPGNNGQRQEMALQDYLIQLQDEQAMPVEITRIRASVLSRNGQPVIGAIPQAISDLYEIYTTANTAIEENRNTLSPAELRQHRINRAYALRALAEIYRAQRDFDWNRIPPNERNGSYAPNFQDSLCYDETITMAQVAREATLAFVELETEYPDEARRYHEEAITANSITADVVYDVAELYAGAQDGNPQGFAAHEAYRDHYRRAFQDVVRYLIPDQQVRVTNRRGETETMEARTVFRRVGLPRAETGIGATEHRMPTIEAITAAGQFRRNIAIEVINEAIANLNAIQANLNRQQSEQRDQMMATLRGFLPQIQALADDDTPVPADLAREIGEQARRVNPFIAQVDAAAARRIRLAQTGSLAEGLINTQVQQTLRRHSIVLPQNSPLLTRQNELIRRVNNGETYGDIQGALQTLLNEIRTAREAVQNRASGNQNPPNPSVTHHPATPALVEEPEADG